MLGYRSAQDVKDKFAKYGPLRDVYLPQDHYTRCGTGEDRRPSGRGRLRVHAHPANAVVHCTK